MELRAGLNDLLWIPSYFFSLSVACLVVYPWTYWLRLWFSWTVLFFGRCFKMNGISHLISPPVQLCTKLCRYSEVNLSVGTYPLVKTNICPSAGSECHSASHARMSMWLFQFLYWNCQAIGNLPVVCSACVKWCRIPWPVNAFFFCFSFKDKIETCFIFFYFFFPSLSYLYISV